jgi:hypothetical protein
VLTKIPISYLSQKNHEWVCRVLFRPVCGICDMTWVGVRSRFSALSYVCMYVGALRVLPDA